jgi:O-antigen ligase
VSLDPGPLRQPDASAEVRAAARRAAETSRGIGPIVAGVSIVVFFMAAFIVLDYVFDQDPHRIFKVALGLGAIGGIMLRPQVGLLILPVVMPFLPWVPPTPIPGLNALNVLLFSIFGTFAFRRTLAHEQLFRPNHLGAYIGALLLVCALSIVRGAAFPTGYSFEAGVAGLVLFRSSTTFTAYWIVHAMVDTEKQRRRVMWAVLAGLLAEALMTMHLGRTGPGGRAIGSIGQSNELGSYLAMFGVIAFAMLPGARTWLGRLVLLTVFTCSTIGLVYSLSRGAMLAFAASMFYAAWRSSKLLFVLIVAAAALSPFWAPDYLVERITSSQVEVEGSDEVELDKAAEARIETWQSLLQVVKQHPIDGIGFTGLGYVLPDIGTALGLADVKDSAHNTYLRMLAEMGVLGILLFVALMGRCLWLAEAVIRRGRSAFDRAIGVALSSATLSMLVACAFGDRFFNVVIASGFWIVCALAESVLTESESRSPA